MMMSLEEAFVSLPDTQEFNKQVDLFRQGWYAMMQKIASLETPEIDGTGEKIIRSIPKMGYRYIWEPYMRDRLDYYFPGWSWEMAAPIQILDRHWVIFQGTLTIIDPSLLVFGIRPPVRKFYGTDAHRVSFKQGETPSYDSMVDLGNDIKAANTDALKVAINRLCHIGDDIYKKRIEMEGSGSRTAVFERDPSFDHFKELLPELGLNIIDAFKLLGCKNAAELETKYAGSYQAAYTELQQVKASMGGGS
jgi:hypothetical protein